MLLHVVLFEPKPDVTDRQQGALLASIADAARTIPSVRQFDVGRRLAGGPVYQANADGDFAFIAIVGFDDRAGLDAYLSHPAHAVLGRLFRETLARALVYDYEMRSATEGVEAILTPRRDGSRRTGEEPAAEER